MVTGTGASHRGRVPKVRGHVPKARGHVPEVRGHVPKVRGRVPRGWRNGDRHRCLSPGVFYRESVIRSNSSLFPFIFLFDTIILKGGGHEAYYPC
ncbi:MAG: hypothetical protein LBU82_05110 [Treponema sp.]|nr:hypothetical protein [Treponema sp.]